MILAILLDGRCIVGGHIYENLGKAIEYIKTHYGTLGIHLRQATRSEEDKWA